MSLAEPAAVAVPHLAPPPPSGSAGAAETVQPPAGPTPAVQSPFLEALPAEMVDVARLPLSYRLASPMPFDPAASAQRATQDPGESAGTLLACNPFYKPISRCVGGRG